MINLAPIVLFVYNRPWHTQQTIEALQKNELTSQTELFIYSDEANNDGARENVDEVRAYLDKIDGFKKVTVIKRDKNWGSADSIIDGVTKIINEYGKIIVLEDDLVTSPYFLKFMNDALDFYADEQKVWHISGWNYPINTDDLDDVFLCRLMHCWGWATWRENWRHFEKNIDKTIDEFSKDDIKRFNLEGIEDFWSQVILNKKGKINTWAIFWYAAIFKQNGLCLNPSQSFVENIGHDGSGVHCGELDNYKGSVSKKKNVNFIKMLNENKMAFERIQRFYKKSKKSLFNKIIGKVLKSIGIRV